MIETSLLVATALSAVAAPAIAQFAAKRTAAQPVAAAPDEERELLAAIVVEPARFRLAAALRVDDFTIGVHQRIWAALDELAEDSDDLDEQRQARMAKAPARRIVGDAGTVVETLARTLDAEAATALNALIDTHVSVNEERFIELGAVVTAATEDREVLNGSSSFVPTSTPGAPLARVYRKPGLFRIAVAAAIVASATVAFGLLDSAVLIVAAGAALGAGLAVLALVDADTFYVDLRTWTMTVTATFGLLAVHAAELGDWTSLKTGAFALVGLGGFVETIAWIHRKIRRIDGYGFGDTMILALTVGAPAAVTGDWRLGVWGFFISLIFAIIGRIVAFAAGSGGLRQPFALGPYLAVGWIPVLVVWAAML